jgi:hypothetical protein
MIDEMRETLTLFVEKALLLRDGAYVKWLTTHGETGFTLSRQNGPTNARPDDSATREFVLTLRMFIQPRDCISFKALAKTAVHDPGLSAQWKQEFVEAHAHLDTFLHAPSGTSEVVVRRLQVGETVQEETVSDTHLTHEDIMNT